MRVAWSVIWSWTIKLALVVSAAMAAACLWIAWCEFSLYGWNEVRLIPTFALVEGVNPYPLIAEGPLFTWIYGPVGMLINLPATLAHTPLQALRIAGCINALMVLGPMLVIFLRSPELRARGALTTVLACLLAVSLIPWPNLILQVADHTAIAFGLLSLWLLAGSPKPSDAQLAGVAALTTLSIWSKQIAVFLVVAQLAFLLQQRQTPAALRYALWLAVFNVLALLLFASVFGFGNLWLNLVEIPGRLGWAEFVPRLQLRLGSLIGQVLLPSIALVLLWRSRRWPTAESPAGRFFHLGALAYGSMLPIGLIAFFKVGGDINLLHSWNYLMPAALLLVFCTPGSPGRMAAITLALVAVALVVRRDVFPLPKQPYSGHLDVAAELTRRLPQAIWFPQNPLITYFADRKIWHSEDGVSTRFLAGYDIQQASFKKHLPPRLQAVAYPSVNTAPFSLPLLSDYSDKTRITYWVLYTRPWTPPSAAVGQNP